jgi:NAD(P)-dependent dehydrogenase (short-subunit alcohol dehydrogenase family)
MEKKNFYALILGVSSGFGKATAIELADRGYNIYGVHLDTGTNKKNAEEFQKELEAKGVFARFFNANAADEKKMYEIIVAIKEDFKTQENPKLRVLMHSLAFGSIKPFFSDKPEEMVTKRNLEMTLDVMANSLIYWTQALFLEKMFAENSRIFAMSSIGSSRVMRFYGSISAAKAAIESYVRQIAVELAPYKITANAILAGLTDTPAAQKIPGFDQMLEFARHHNPFSRNTKPEDVAQAISMLVDEKFYWINGQVLGVDGGESILNFLE